MSGASKGITVRDRFWWGREYFFQWAKAPEAGDPFFHGGEVVVTWLLTGETRTYNTARRFLERGLPGKDRVPRWPRRLGRRSCASPTSTSTAATSGEAASGG